MLTILGYFSLPTTNPELNYLHNFLTNRPSESQNMILLRTSEGVSQFISASIALLMSSNNFSSNYMESYFNLGWIVTINPINVWSFYPFDVNFIRICSKVSIKPIFRSSLIILYFFLASLVISPNVASTTIPD